jgi:hypothetical protein
MPKLIGINDRPKIGDTMHISINADLPQKIVRIDFGRELSWLAFDPDTTRALAEALLTAARAIDGRMQ